MRATEFIIESKTPDWLNEFAPEGFDQYSLYTGDGVSSHLIDKFSSLQAAKEEVEFIWDTDPEARLVVWFIKNLNDEVVWYYDPQELADKPRWHYKKSDDLEEMAGIIDYGIADVLKEKGYQFLGGGLDKQAWLDPNGQVYIVFGYRYNFNDFSPDQRMFITWIKYCDRNRNNPHLPKFSGFESFEFNGKKYIQARMERLTHAPAKLQYLLAHLDWMITKHGTNYDRAFDNLAPAAGYDWETFVSSKIDQKKVTAAEIIEILGGIDKAKSLMKTVRNVKRLAARFNYSIDLHGGNYMLRPDGTIVVNDPYAILDRNLRKR